MSSVGPKLSRGCEAALTLADARTDSITRVSPQSPCKRHRAGRPSASSATPCAAAHVFTPVWLQGAHHPSRLPAAVRDWLTANYVPFTEPVQGMLHLQL